MTENPYIFLQKKSLTTTLNDYLTCSQTPCFIVNHFAHIHFIAEITKKTSFIIKNTQKSNTSLYLLSPPNAISYMGARWWLAFIDKTRSILPQHQITDILDCYDHAGLAMAALRIGQKNILFDSKSPQLQTLKNRALSIKANILDTSPFSFNLLPLNFKKNNLSR